jgi:phospholipase C
MSYDVGTVFIVMMENRSFDHMLGHLHASNPAVDGIRRDDPAWLSAHSNRHEGQSYQLRQSRTPDDKLPGDPPHGRDAFELQLGAGAPGAFALDGFVANYAKAKERPRIDPAHPPAVMDWFDSDDVPVLSFLASQFAVCNRWHAALPAATQPNKMMAMGGATLLDHNQKGLPKQRLVYDWLEDVETPWRVYFDGLPFFAMMPNWSHVVVHDRRFRKFERFAADLAAADPASFPRVVFIEPCYTSSPQFGTANDDHAPNGVARGQAFLRKVYEAIAASPLWSRSVTIITYDENGGFYDHVSPPAVTTNPPPGGNYRPFQTLGLRVPTVIVSPYVRAGTVSNTLFDHTSILKMLGSLFGGQYGYEYPVNARPVGNAIDVLNNPGGRAAPRMHHGSAEKAFEALGEFAPAGGRVPGTLPSDDLETSFQMALDEIRKTPDPEGKFADLLAAFPPLTDGLPTSASSEAEALGASDDR